MNTQRINTIDALRGIASFAVCWFHLTNGNKELLPEGFFKSSGAYGWVGVEIFFVISGFIIPYALHSAGYSLNFYRIFIVKRVLRLDPPYLVTIVLVMAVTYAATLVPGFKGAVPAYSLVQVLLHLGYLNVFFDYPWINIVFWTLAIEFQYYVLIGLLFPLLKTKKAILLFLGFSLLAVLIPSKDFIFHYIFLFIVGILTFQFKANLISRRVFYSGVLLSLGGVFLTLGLLVTVVGAATAWAIAFASFESRVLGFLGKISYSLYLLHTVVGGRVLNLGTRVTDSFWGKVSLILLAAGLSILSAYLLYLLVEKPSQAWSSKVRYQAKEPRGAGLLAGEASL